MGYFRNRNTLGTLPQLNVQCGILVTAAFHFDASKITGLSDNDPVATWADLRGGNSFTQSTADYKPLYKTNIQNSLPGVLFDGSNDFMTLSYTFNAAAFTFLAVFKMADDPIGSFPGWGSMVKGTDTKDYDSVARGVLVSMQAGTVQFFSNETLYSKTTAPSDGDSLVYVTRCNGTNNKLWTQDDDYDAVARTDTLDVDTFCIGSRYNNGATEQHQNLYIFEMAFWAEALTNTQVYQVMEYLQNKWGIT